MTGGVRAHKPPTMGRTVEKMENMLAPTRLHGLRRHSTGAGLETPAHPSCCYGRPCTPADSHGEETPPEKADSPPPPRHKARRRSVGGLERSGLGGHARRFRFVNATQKKAKPW